MKILPVDLIRKADAYTLKHEPIADIDLMERASAECFRWMVANFNSDRTVKIFCGTGNNGGDGLAIARMLFGEGYNTEVYLAGDDSMLSASCRINFERLGKAGNGPDWQGCHVLNKNNPLPEIRSSDVVIDAIFGSGLTRPPEGLQAEVIRHINGSQAPVISIDIPSGLFCDATIKEVKDPAVIRAAHTLTFSPPKLALLFPENGPYVGEWHLLDIGLKQEFIDSATVINYYITPEICQAILHRRNKFAHKGSFGHALLFCGSLGKMGAAVLATHACLRSGAGLVTVHVPKQGTSILQTTLPEAMLSIDESGEIFTSVPDLAPYSAIAAGPGIGQNEQTGRALKLLIQNSLLPVVFDADAINILAENKTWLGFLKPGCIFTPHPKEFERLAGKSSNDFERNLLQRNFSIKYQACVVLKGAHTAVTTPSGECFFNSTGNPGMATGGSGDVLTGIIAGIMAQGYSGVEASIMGVYLHGLSGGIAAASSGYEALIAGDIINNLGTAFQSLYGKF